MPNLQHLPQEEWAELPHLDYLYRISNYGRLLSVRNGIILKPYIQEGYRRYLLSFNRRQVKIVEHRLVALHFVPNPLNLPHVNHINRVRNDNRALNLEWVTLRENTLKIHGKTRLQKITTNDINDMYIMSKTMSFSEIGKRYGIDRSTINKFLCFLHPEY